jgi:N-carbamoyl-L-amino-acid hydrolase
MLALIALDRDGVETALPIRAIAMRGEESAIFGHAYTGSLAMFGRLVPQALAARSALDGAPLSDAMAACGVDTSRVARGEPLADASRIAFFLELHIEQGPLLLSRGWPVATVTGIRGNVRHREIRCVGEAGHSGAVPRWLRRDAVMATADLLMRMDDHWSEIEQQGGDLVLTAGIIHTDTSHNAMSRIPGETTFSFEARSQHLTTIRAVEALLQAECAEIARDRGVRFAFDAPVHSPEAMLDTRVTAALTAACAAEHLPTEKVPSGAGHDAAIFQLAGVPSGMLFVRNANGSHNPDEDMDVDDMLKGARVLRRAAEALAGAPR